MKKQIILTATALTFIFTQSSFAEDAKKEEPKEETKKEAPAKEDPSKTGKKTLNSIFAIPLKSKEGRHNKLLDAGNDLLKKPRQKKPAAEKTADEKPEAEKK